MVDVFKMPITPLIYTVFSIQRMKSLDQTEVVNLLRSYQNFLKSYNKDCRITKNNLKQLQHLSNRLRDKLSIRQDWGCTFDEIYTFLELPEIQSKIQTTQKHINQKNINDIYEPDVLILIKNCKSIIDSYNESNKIAVSDLKEIRHISNLLERSFFSKNHESTFDEIYSFLANPEIAIKIRICFEVKEGTYYNPSDEISNKTLTKIDNICKRLNNCVQNSLLSKEDVTQLQYISGFVSKSYENIKLCRSNIIDQVYKLMENPKMCQVILNQLDIIKQGQSRKIVKSIMTKENKIRKQRNIQSINVNIKLSVMPPYNMQSDLFDEDILNEKIAEAKGYEGSK